MLVFVSVSVSHAILRFLARRYGYIPPKSIDAEAAADMLAGAVEDVHRKYSAVVYSESWETLLDSYLKDTLPMWLNYFEALLKKRQTPFYLGARVAYPDILVSVDCSSGHPTRGSVCRGLSAVQLSQLSQFLPS